MIQSLLYMIIIIVFVMIMIVVYFGYKVSKAQKFQKEIDNIRIETKRINENMKSFLENVVNDFIFVKIVEMNNEKIACKNIAYEFEYNLKKTRKQLLEYGINKSKEIIDSYKPKSYSYDLKIDKKINCSDICKTIFETNKKIEENIGYLTRITTKFIKNIEKKD